MTIKGLWNHWEDRQSHSSKQSPIYEYEKALLAKEVPREQPFSRIDRWENAQRQSSISDTRGSSQWKLGGAGKRVIIVSSGVATVVLEFADVFSNSLIE